MKTDEYLGFEVIALILLTVGYSIANNLAATFWLGSPSIRPFGYFQFRVCLRGLAGWCFLSFHSKKNLGLNLD
jgi:hypothetical protein